MRGIVASLFFLASFTAFTAQRAPRITIADTINPGTADFITHEISLANESKAPFLVIQLDTPGGLLTSTRQIVQSILNSQTPIVIWVGPRGAQAGSAGAIITFAADVAVMATGSNIGAAHPIQGSGQELNKTVNDKMTNDTAAFAEGLARAKGRNSAWAKLAVTESKSISAEDALKLKVIDFIADDEASLFNQLAGYKLQVAKGELTHLPKLTIPAELHSPSLKHRIVSFFANPSLAYLILTLGGLCVWIELSHPGLILPGVVGGFCILISMISFQLMPIRFGALGLLLFGLALLIAEVYVTSYGVLGVGGLISFILGSIFIMDTNVPEFQIPYTLIFPVATCLVLSLLFLSYVVLKTKRLKLQEHYLGLIGSHTQANTDISLTSGTVFLQGELWKAQTKEDLHIPKGSWVTVIEVRGLILIVQEKEKTT